MSRTYRSKVDAWLVAVLVPAMAATGYVALTSLTSNPLASPALSLDRLKIEYGQGHWIMISPRDREGFLRELESRRSAL